MISEPSDALLALEAGFEQANQRIGRFNLAIFGMTGVGKSTLVNTIFGEELARTGVGRPVTRGSHLHRTADSTMGIYDTEGLEIGRDSAEIVAGLQRQIEDSHTGPLADQIHVVWYCVRASDRRFTEMESDFVRHVCDLGPPVLLVITRTALASGSVPPDTRELGDHIEHQNLPIYGKGVYFVNAQSDEWAGVPAHGLNELLEATSAAAPIGVQRALNAAQRINSARKREQANELVRTTAANLELRPLLRNVRKSWAEMIAGIAIIYGLPENQAINAALQAREVAAMHRLLYLGQASVLATPIRYVALGGARAKRSLVGAARKKPDTWASGKESAAGADSKRPPAAGGGEKTPAEAGRKKNTRTTKTRTRRRIRRRRLRTSTAGTTGTTETTGTASPGLEQLESPATTLPKQSSTESVQVPKKGGLKKRDHTRSWIKRRRPPGQSGNGTGQRPTNTNHTDAIKPPTTRQPQRMGSGLAAGVVTLAVGESWVAVCDRAYRASYPEPPGLQPDLFVKQFSEELSMRMSKPLRAWRRISTRRDA